MIYISGKVEGFSSVREEVILVLGLNLSEGEHEVSDCAFPL